MPLERQPDNLPTNKALASVASLLIAQPFIEPAVKEVWPQIVPAFLAGANMTALMASLITGAFALGVAWITPDRAGTPTS